MGKATIISEQGEGLYTIQPEWDTTVALAMIASLTADNDAIDARLAALPGEITSAELAMYTAADVLRAAIINEYVQAEIDRLERDFLKKQTEYHRLSGLQSFLQLKKTANTKKISFLQERAATPAQIQAWCADYTEGVTGEVGTIEVGRRDTTPIINPGGVDGAAGVYTAASDGAMTPVLSSSPAAAFVNYALLPGAAKWKPRFRTGIASNISTADNTMDVALDPLRINGVECNQTTALTGIPVSYMTCNAAAFAPDDRVIVEFADGWASATVVGFVSNPRPCAGGLYLRLTINGTQCLRGGQQILLRYTTTGGSTVTTPARVIPAVGAPLDVDPLLSVPASNQSLAGPFALTDWDETTIDVLLHRERKNDNTGVDFKHEKATAGAETVHDLRLMYDYYTDVGTNYAEANCVINQEDYVLWGTRANDETTPGCFDISQRRRVYFAGNGINEIITASSNDGEWVKVSNNEARRGYRLGNYARLNVYKIAELTKAEIDAATDESVMDLIAGESTLGQVVDVAGTAVFKGIKYDLPASHPYSQMNGSYYGTTHSIIYDDGIFDRVETILDSEREPWQDAINPLGPHQYFSPGCVEEQDPVTGIVTVRVPIGESVGMQSDSGNQGGRGVYFTCAVADGATVPAHAVVSVGTFQTLLHTEIVTPVQRDGVWVFEAYSAHFGGNTVSVLFEFPTEVILQRTPVQFAGLDQPFCSPRSGGFAAFGYRAVERNLGENAGYTVEFVDVWQRSRVTWPNGRSYYEPETFAPFFGLLGFWDQPRVQVVDMGSGRKTAAIPYSSIDEQYSKAQAPVILYDPSTGTVTPPAATITEAEENLLAFVGTITDDYTENHNWQFNFTGVDIDVAGYL